METPRLIRLKQCAGTASRVGVYGIEGYFLRLLFMTEGGRVAWIVRVVKTGAGGEGHCTDVMEIMRPADLSDIADLGLTLADAKLLLASLQQAIVTGQARDHAARRPAGPRCGEACQVKDYRERGVATLFGRVTVRLPRFRCAACGGIEAGTTGRRIVGRPLNWISFRRISAP
jgi:hypothetical protein